MSFNDLLASLQNKSGSSNQKMQPELKQGRSFIRSRNNEKRFMIPEIKAIKQGEFHTSKYPDSRGGIPKHNPDLKQGRLFREYQHDYVEMVKPELPLIEETTEKQLGSIKESLEGMDSTQQKTQQYQSSENTKISQLEDEFNTILSQYTTNYKTFINELLQRNKAQSTVSQYFGKTVDPGDGTYVYINDYGYTHKYSADAWASNDSSCPAKPVDASGVDLSFLAQGPGMVSHQACQIAGRNIKNADTNEVAWVDIKGNKHVYSDDIWSKKENSCDLPSTKISGKQYDLIPAGSNMTTTTVCDQLGVNPQLWQKLLGLNAQLTTIAQQMIVEMKKLLSTDSSIHSNMQKKRQTVNDYLGTLDKDRERLQRASQGVDDITGELDDSKIKVTESYYYYLAWSIAAVTVGAYTIKYLARTN